MNDDGEILEKRMIFCFKLMFYLIAFLFTVFQLLIFLFLISLNLWILFFYLGFLIDIAILLIITVNLRKRVFSLEIGVSNNKEKVINEINKYNQKVKPCFYISLIALFVLFIIIVIVLSYSITFILFYLLIALMLFLILLNLPLSAFGRLLNSALSKEIKE